jgi:hypothetical protein
LRSSIFGSAAHIRKAATSLPCCSIVEGLPSSKVTLPGASGGGMPIAPPSGVWCAAPCQAELRSPGK